MFFAYQLRAAAVEIPLDDDVYEYLVEQCEFREVPVALALAIMEAESGFRADLVSNGNYGLFQINHINFKFLRTNFGEDWDQLSPRDSISGGLYIFAGYLKVYNVHKACMAFNLGHGGAKQLWRQGIYSTGYSRKIVRLWGQWEDLLND